MNSVLGVSVGSGAIRIARPRYADMTGRFTLDSFELESVDTTYQQVEDLVAESIGAVIDSGTQINATAVAYRSEQDAEALRTAMARQQLTNYELIPETAAALECLEATGEVRGLSCVVIYDLGSSGLTVSIVDTATRTVRYAERTDEISGDLFDALIREHQISSGRIAAPRGPEGFVELDARCRQGKEQLSINPAAALPSDTGLALLAREDFEAMIRPAIEASARMTFDVINRAGGAVEAVVAIGGGARIPLVRNLLRESAGLPLIVTDGPETVVARGAAMLAKPVGPITHRALRQEVLKHQALRLQASQRSAGPGVQPQGMPPAGLTPQPPMPPQGMPPQGMAQPPMPAQAIGEQQYSAPTGPQHAAGSQPVPASANEITSVVPAFVPAGPPQRTMPEPQPPQPQPPQPQAAQATQLLAVLPMSAPSPEQATQQLLTPTPAEQPPSQPFSVAPLIPPLPKPAASAPMENPFADNGGWGEPMQQQSADAPAWLSGGSDLPLTKQRGKKQNKQTAADEWGAQPNQSWPPQQDGNQWHNDDAPIADYTMSGGSNRKLGAIIGGVVVLLVVVGAVGAAVVGLGSNKSNRNATPATSDVVTTTEAVTTTTTTTPALLPPPPAVTTPTTTTTTDAPADNYHPQWHPHQKPPPPPPAPGPNTFTVPGLPPIVIPTIPR